MLRFLRTFTLILFCAAAVLSLAGLALWKTEGMRFYSVQTASMSPWLQPGDLELTKKPRQLNIGDIVSYASPRDPSLIISHRVYALEPAKGFIVTKGDNLAYPDPPISYRSVTGRTIKAIPKAGYLFDFLHKPAGLIILVYVPALMICGFEFSQLILHFLRRSYGIKAPSS
jgi:signal peptidase I